jgi:hypothetical protein
MNSSESEQILAVSKYLLVIAKGHDTELELEI